MRILLTIVFLAVVLSSTQAWARKVCQVDETCPKGMVCISGTCRVPTVDQERCKEHSECRQNRICVRGVCRKPRKPKPPLVGPKYYAGVSIFFEYPVWSRMNTGAVFFHPLTSHTGEADYSSPTMLGLRLAGYLASSNLVHIGVYQKIRAGIGSISPGSEGISLTPDSGGPDLFFGTGTGLSLKIGFSPKKRLRGGIEFETGFHTLRIPGIGDGYAFPIDRKFMKGIELATYLHFDLLSIGDRSHKLAMPFRLGAECVPFARLQPYKNPRSLDYYVYEDTNGHPTHKLGRLVFEMSSISVFTSIGLEFSR